MRRCRSSSSIRISETARSSSVADSLHLRVLDDARHRHDLVAAHDQRPRLPLRARHLRVDEHVLDLAPPTRQPVAGPPSTHSKPFELRADGPVAPPDFAGQLDRPALEPEALVLAHRLQASAEVDALGADGRREQLGERWRERLASVEGTQEVLVGARMEAAQERQDLLSDQPALRFGVRRVEPELQAGRATVLLSFRAPERQKRMHHPIVARRCDSSRRSARDEPVQGRLDLVRGRLAGGTPAGPGRYSIASTWSEAVWPVARSRSRATERRCSRRPASERPRPSITTTSAPSASVQKRASSSDSAPRSLWFTCNAEAR